MGRQGDKSLRRAFSNGQIAARVNVNAEPIKRSGLWRSWSAADQARAEDSNLKYVHPAMMSPVSDVQYISDIEESEDETSVEYSPSLSPRIEESRQESVNGQLNLPELSLEDSITCNDRTARPPLVHRGAYGDVPTLLLSRSDESLAESEEWDEDASPVQELDRPIGQRWELKPVGATPLLVKPAKALLDWGSPQSDYESDPSVRVEIYNGVGVVYSH